MQTPRYLAAGLILCASLAACGGGGGGGGTTSGGNPPTPTPASTPTLTPSTTNASGTVVDDQTGAALAGVKVVVMPWGNGPGTCNPTPQPATSITPQNDGCPTPLPSPQVTTDPNGKFTLSGVANGHYLLVIGNDVAYTPPPGYTPPTCTTGCGTPTPAPFQVQAVVHDNVTLTGGNQTLVAPTMPPIPTVTPPAWELSGKYRLAMLDKQWEMPCYIGWEYAREQRSLAGSSVDEWITENTRSINAWQMSSSASGSVQTLTTGHGGDAGGTDCANSLVQLAFGGQNSYATDARTIWFNGQWLLYEKQGTTFYQGIGFTEFTIDPRSFQDPNIATWP